MRTSLLHTLSKGSRSVVALLLPLILGGSLLRAGTITVTYPNGGETFKGGYLTWTNTDSHTVKIELLKNGVVATLIQDGWYGNNIYWFPTGLAAGADYRLRVTSDADTTNTDTSDADFTIPAFVNIYDPGSGSVVPSNRTYDIFWAATGGNTVQIDLYKGGVFQYNITQSAPNTSGDYYWAVPAGQTPGKDYKMRITCPAGGTVFGEQTFEIAAPAVHVDSPNGGENYARGTSLYIYLTGPSSDTYTIDLLKNGTKVSTLSTTSYTYFYWTISSSLALGSDYTIRATSNTDPTLTDTSDAPFTIDTQKVSVTYPTAGASFNVGQYYDVQWSPNFSAAFNVDLLKGGVFLRSIDSAEQFTDYYWYVPSDLTTGADYQIRVTQNVTTNPVSATSGNFTIVSTDATVTYPNGGESFTPGDYKSLTWTSTTLNTGYVPIELWDGTTTKILTITTSASNNGSYYWYVPKTVAAGSNYKIKIANDFSDAPFTINGYLNVDYPYYREIGSGANQTITWDSNLAGNVKLEVFNSNNVLAQLVSASTANSGSYLWDCELATGNYKITITVLNSTPVVSGSNTFSVAPKILTVYSPNGGQSLVQRQSTTFQWYANIQDNVKLELIGAQTFLVAASVSSNSYSNYSSYDYTIPSTVPLGAYKLRVTSVTNAALTDDSDATFNIVNPALTVNAPNTAVTFTRGFVNYIGWTPNFYTGTVKIELLKNGVLQTPPIATGVNNSNQSYGWTIPLTQTIAADYKIRVTHESEVTAVDDSDVNFSIGSLALAMTAPNGSEVWQLGSQHQITWNTTPALGYVNLDLYKGGTFLRSIAANQYQYYSGNVFYWTVPGDLTPGNNYRVRVTSTTDTTVFDDSDANFTIAPKLLVTAPNGSEVWPRGTTQQITWSSAGDASKNIRVELLDGSSNVALQISGGTPDNGSFSWAIPGALQTTSYRIRLTRLDDATITDTSDNYFSIADKQLSLSQPGGGEHLPVGFDESIRWTSNMGGTCRIDLMKGGVLFTTLATVSNPLNGVQNIYTWHVTQAIGTTYRILITCLNDTSVTATSFSDFAIENPRITMTAPALNAQVVAGNQIYAQWTTNFPAEVKVLLFKGGSLLTTLTADQTNSGYYYWSVPYTQTLGANYQVKVATLDDSVSDITPQFAVVPMTLQVTAPNGGEHWSAGTNRNITLSTNADGSSGNTVNVDLLKSGSVVRNIFSGVGLSANASYYWQIPADLALGTDYRIRATHGTQAALTDDSDANFSIVPRMQVLKPDGSAVNYPGTPVTITWQSGVDENVRIELLSGSSAVDLFSSTVNDGSEVWNIPANQPDGYYNIRITSVLDPLITHTGPQFSIQAKTISIGAPGSDVARGYAYPIYWSTNFAGHVKLELMRIDAQNNETLAQSITTDTLNNGSFSTWTIPSGLTTGPTFKLKISHLTDPVVAYSPAFSISLPSLTVTAPSGSPQLVHGTNASISWTTNFSASYKIDLLQNGTFNQSITASTSSTGFSWSIPANLQGSNFSVRVSTLDGSVTNTSDAFSIIAHSLTMTAPVSGAKFSVGTYLSASWTSNFQSNVKIELLKNGVLDTLINASASNGGGLGYFIPVLQAPGTDYSVRVTSVVDSTGTGTSPGNFEIRANQKPVANAGPDQSVKETRIGFAQVTLDGGGSTDDGSLSPLTYTWKNGETVIGSGAIIHLELPLGDTTLTLAVYDGQYTITDDVTVHVLANSPPVANAGPDQTVSQTLVNGCSVGLSGGASTDDGSIGPLTFLWKENGVTLSTVSDFSQVFSVGVHTLTLTVNDGQYSSDSTVKVTVLPVPNLVVQSVVVPAETYTGQSFDVTWTVKNIGGGTARGPWADHLYLSEDTLVGNDTDLGYFTFAGTLAPGESVTRTQVVKVNNKAGFLDKAYYVLVNTDGADLQNQSHVFEGPFENDNVTASLAFNVRPLPLPDLIVESITAPTNVFSGQQVTVNYVIKNQGTGGTDLPVWYDRIFLSVDNTPDGGDLLQNSLINVSALAPGERYTGTFTFTVPVEVAGPFHIIIKANDDGQNKLLETDETNNINSVNLLIEVPATADLQITHFNASDAGFSGQPVLVNWTVENKGPVPAISGTGVISDRVYLSLNQTLEPDKDYLLGTFTHTGNLNSGEGYTQSARSVTLPKYISGQWYLIIFTDSDNKIFEHAGEANNLAVLPLTVFRSPDPDFIVTAVNPPATGNGGHNFTLSWTVKNQGAGDATGAWLDSIYLSKDQTLRSDAINVGSFVQSNLTEGQSYTKSGTLTLPQELSGDYYVLVYADAPHGPFNEDSVLEYDPGYDAEANNVTSSASKVHFTWTPPDLQVTGVTAPPSALASKNISVGWTVKNFGPGDSCLPNWDDRIYISTFSTLDPQRDRNLGGGIAHLGLLNNGDSYSQSTTVTLPVDLPAGKYYVYVATDTSDNVKETGHEDNNVGSTTFTVQVENTPPDLFVTGVSVPASVPSGRTFNFSWTVMNKGTGPTLSDSGWTDQVYLSKSPVLVPGDSTTLTLLPFGGFGQGGTLAPQATYNGMASYKLPYGIVGTWYLIVSTDATQTIYEGDESNNQTASAPFTITLTPAPDLQLTAVSAAPTSAQSGQFVNVTYTVINNGTGPIDPDTLNWSDHVYISRDLVLDPTDALVGRAGHSGQLAVGDSYTQTVQVELPRDISGPYNLFVVTDAEGQVFESDDSNNVKSCPLPVTLAPPSDLVVSVVNVPVAGGGLPGDSRVFGWTVQNIGPNKADGTWTDNVYLSSDTQWDFKDVLLGHVVHNGTLLPTQTYDALLTANLPAVIPGNYHVIVRTDIRNNIREVDETNNIGVSTQTITMDVPILPLGVPTTGVLTQSAERYYKVNVPDKADVLITLVGDDQSNFNDLFAAQAYLPTEGFFQFEGDNPYQANQQIIIPEVIGGYYYILVHGNKVSGLSASYTLTAKVLDFSIVDVIPNKGSNAGRLTTQIRGAKFTAVTTATLVSGAVERPAQKMYFADGTKIFATFDLTGLTPGLFDVRVNDQGKSALLPNGFTVIQGSPKNIVPVEAAIFSPAGLLIGRVSVLTVGYANTTDNDLDAPLFQPFSDFSRMRLSGDMAYDQNGENIIGINFHGPAGILPPGVRASIPYAFTSLISTSVLAHHSIPQYTTANATPVDWGSVQKQVRPDGLDDATWSAAWARFLQQTGSQYGGFITVLDQTATTLSLQQNYVFRVRDLFRDCIDQEFQGAFDNVQGTVYIADYRHPAPAGVTVQLIDNSNQIDYSGQTNSDGTFNLAQVPAGTYTLGVPGFSVSTSTQVTVGSALVSLTVTVAPGGSITGNVLDSLAAPIIDALVFAADADGNTYNTDVDANGLFSLSGLPYGIYTVTVSQDGYAPVMSAAQTLSVATPKASGVTLVLPAAGILSGTCKSSAAEQAALAGVSIALAKDKVGIAGGVSDDTGAYHIGSVPPGTYTLSATKNGFAVLQIANFTIAAAQVATQNLSLDPGATLNVTVTSNAGIVNNATLTLSSGLTIVQSGQTDATGKCTFSNLAAGSYNVNANSDSFGKNDAQVTLTKGQTAAVSVSLVTSGEIIGTVQTQGTLAPISNVAVVAVEKSSGKLFKTTIDVMGNYFIGALNAGDFAVQVQTGNTVGTGRQDITLTAGGVSTVNFSLLGGSITGKLLQLDGTTGASPAFAALVQAGNVVLTVPTDSTGAYCFKGVAAGSYSIEGYGKQNVFSPINVTVADGQVVQNANLTSGGLSVTVTISDAAGPVSKGVVKLSTVGSVLAQQAASATDASGNVTISGLLPGAYSLTSAALGDVAVTQTLTIPASGPVPSVQVTLAKEAALTVTVKNGGGTVLSGAKVVVYAPGLTDPVSGALSDTNGAAALSGLAAGNYDIEVIFAGYQVYNQSNVALSAGGGSLQVTLAPSSTTLSGVVRDAGGAKPIFGAAVNVLDAQGRPAGSAVTAYDGSYSINTLASGACTLRVSARGYAVSSPNVTVTSASTFNPQLTLVGVPDPLDLHPYDFAKAMGQAALAIVGEFYNTPKRDVHDPFPNDFPPYPVSWSRCKSSRAVAKDLFKLIRAKNGFFEQWQEQGIVTAGQLKADVAVLLLKSVVLAGDLASIALIPEALEAEEAYIAEKGLEKFVKAGPIGKASAYETEALVDLLGYVSSSITGIVQLAVDLPGAFTSYDNFKNFAESFTAKVASGYASIKSLQALLLSTTASSSPIGVAVFAALTAMIDFQDVTSEFITDAEEILNLVKDMAGKRRAYTDALDRYLKKSHELIIVGIKCASGKDEPYDEYTDTPLNGLPKPKPPGSGGSGGGFASGLGAFFTQWIRPRDPNEKFGPPGFGPQHFVAASSAMTYTVECENQSTSTAPVQKLTINDQLDPNLDLRTFRIKEIVLGNITIAVPDNVTNYSARTQLGADQGNISIDVFAGVDIFTGKSFLIASATDPATGDRPTRPDLGFMPPNDATHRGEGHIIYSVSPKPGVPTGAIVKNVATIIFNALETIDTNVVTNTIDGLAPVSGVTALPALSDERPLNISWSGQDEANGSGLKNYDVYVSDNSGAYTLWQDATTDTSASFPAEIGHTYAFYSVARDNAGNLEATPSAPDMVVTEVTHVNRVPTTSGIADVSVLQNAAPSPIDLRASFDDLEDGAAGLTYTLIVNSNASLFNAATVDNASGKLTLTYSGQTGVSSLTVLATDSGGLTVLTSFTVTVAALPPPLVAPKITSKLTESATVGTPYTYTITASGSSPITFTAKNLPDGFKFDGTVISGTPTAAGVFKIALSAANGTPPDDAQTLTLTIAAIPVTTVTFSSGISATPSPALVGQKVTFTALATSSSALTYTWSYGDGASDAGASVSHPFSPAKTYTVTVTATNVEGVSATSSIMLLVNPMSGGAGGGAGAGTLPGEIDSDGDGFSDAVEKAAGSDPFDPNSIPGGKGTLVQATVSNPVLKTNTKKKMLILTGSLHIPKGFAPKDQTLVADIGGFIGTFQLDLKGAGKSGTDTFKMSLKIKKGTIAEQNVLFKLVLNSVPDTVQPSSPLVIIIGGTVFVKGQ